MAVGQQGGLQSPDEPRDPALDRVYGAGRREEAPAGLDAAILAAARREVHARPRPLGSVMRGWRAPVALAAVLVLSVTVVLLMREEGADRLAESPASVLPSAPTDARTPAQAAGTPDNSLMAQDKASRAAAESAKPALPREDAVSGLRDAPSPRAAEEDRRKEEVAKQLSERARQEAPRPAPRPFAEPSPARAEPKLSAPEATSSNDALAKRAQPGATSGQTSERAEREQQPAQRPAAPPAAHAPPAAAAPDSSVGSVAPQPPTIRRAAPEASEAGQGMRDNAAAASRPLWQGYEAQPPEKWLERVEELHRAGRGREAREMLAEFRKRFPQHPVPATLER